MAKKQTSKAPKALTEMDTFMVALLKPGNSIEEIDQSHPLHDSVIRPLIRHARECRIYGLDYDRKFLKSVSSIVEKKGRCWQLKLDREVIAGYERLWNDVCVTNGIAVVCELSDEQMGEIFRHTSRPGFWSSLNMLAEGSSKAAVSFCQKAVDDPKAVAILFPGSNGIEWMDVFASTKRLEKLYKLARSRGRFGATS